MSAVDWKKKCDGCGKFFNKSEMNPTFGGFKCNDCLRIQYVNKQGTLHIPMFLRRKYKIDKAKVILKERPDGILIKKFGDES